MSDTKPGFAKQDKYEPGDKVPCNVFGLLVYGTVKYCRPFRKARHYAVDVLGTVYIMCEDDFAEVPANA